MNILLVLVFAIVLFIIGREIVCWYFKMNRVIELLENIEENTKPKKLTNESLEKPKDLV